MTAESASGGALYIVATPIGNLQDLSPRALEALRAADLVAAEDTRRARTLLAHAGLRKPLESFHGDSGPAKAEKLLRRLRAGQRVAYVSDGGTPGIADPGAELVAAAAAEGFAVTPIPGPCALAAALSVSGFTADRFLFGGFPPRKAGELRDFLQGLLAPRQTAVLYESPHRVGETLRVLGDLAPERPLVVGREITKQFEEWLRGTARDLAAVFAEREARGEFVIVIGPAPAQTAEGPDPQRLAAGLRRLLAAGMAVREAAEVAATWGVAGKREAYQMALEIRKEDPASGEK